MLAAPDVTVYLVEGEKDADRLVSALLYLGLPTSGAGKWKLAHSEFLRGRRVVILPDNDEAGRDHAKKANKSLRDIAAEVRIVAFQLPEKGDVSDWLDAGGSVQELVRMHSDAAPATPSGEEEEDEGRKPGQTDLLVVRQGTLPPAARQERRHLPCHRHTGEGTQDGCTSVS